MADVVKNFDNTSKQQEELLRFAVSERLWAAENKYFVAEDDDIVKEFHAKDILLRNGYAMGLSSVEWIKCDLDEFWAQIFWRSNLDKEEDCIWEEWQSAEYLIWRKQEEAGIPNEKKDYSGYTKWRYNPIVTTIVPKKSKGDAPGIGHRVISKGDDDAIAYVKGRYFAISAPATFVGGRNINKYARHLYAIGIDLDGVGVDELEGLWRVCSTVNPDKDICYMPMPNIITNSGHGLHLYYLLERPVALCNNRTWKLCQRLKDNLTKLIWQPVTTRIKREQMQLQPILQCFRLPGSRTKFGEVITAWVASEVPLYTIAVLNRYSSESLALTDEEVASVGVKGKGLEYAKNHYPDWYQARIVEKKVKGQNRWMAGRGLYDWWLMKAKQVDEKIVGHRFWTVMALFIYGKKCGVEIETVLHDAMELQKFFDTFSPEKNPFTEADVAAARNAYQDVYNTFPGRKIENLTGISFDRKIRRNGRKQAVHLKRARLLRDADYPDGAWINRNGRPKGSVVKASDSPQAQIVVEWRRNHPESTNKALCARETSLSRTTVTKWWNAIVEERTAVQINARGKSGKTHSIVDTSVQQDGVAIKEGGGHRAERPVVDMAKIFLPGAISPVEGYTTEEAREIVTSGRWKDLGWELLY